MYVRAPGVRLRRRRPVQARYLARRRLPTRVPLPCLHPRAPAVSPPRLPLPCLHPRAPAVPPPRAPLPSTRVSRPCLHPLAPCRVLPAFRDDSSAPGNVTDAEMLVERTRRHFPRKRWPPLMFGALIQAHCLVRACHASRFALCDGSTCRFSSLTCYHNGKAPS